MLRSVMMIKWWVGVVQSGTGVFFGRQQGDSHGVFELFTVNLE